MRKKIVFGMAIISLVAIIVLCQKAGVRLKETFRESEETNSGAVIGMKEKENEKSDKKERGEKQGEAHKKRTVVVDAAFTYLPLTGSVTAEKRESTGSLRKS